MAHMSPPLPPDPRSPDSLDLSQASAADAVDGDSRPREAAGPQARARLSGARLTTARGSRVRARVVLERHGRQYSAEREGVGEDVVALRLVAETTIDCLEQCIGRPGSFEPVGIKRLHAFDSLIILVCVGTLSGRPRKLVGCVPQPEDPVRGAATTVLDATNRLVEALPADGGPTRVEGGGDS